MVPHIILLGGRLLQRQLCRQKHANKLIPAYREPYNVAEDWNGRLYCVITLKGYYPKMNT